MKKWISLLLVFGMLLSVSACGTSTSNNIKSTGWASNFVSNSGDKDLAGIYSPKNPGTKSWDTAYYYFGADGTYKKITNGGSVDLCSYSVGEDYPDYRYTCIVLGSIKESWIRNGSFNSNWKYTNTEFTAFDIKLVGLPNSYEGVPYIKRNAGLDSAMNSESVDSIVGEYYNGFEFYIFNEDASFCKKNVYGSVEKEGTYVFENNTVTMTSYEDTYGLTSDLGKLYVEKFEGKMIFYHSNSDKDISMGLSGYIYDII